MSCPISRVISRSMLSTGALTMLLLAVASASNAQTTSNDEKLLIVNGNTGRVIYDDGRNDLFCVTRQVFVGYSQYGRPLYRRTMRCR